MGSVSCSFNQVEWNYDIHDQELLAIIYGLQAWRHILLSTLHIITIYTNHKNLTFYRSAHRIAQQVAQYLGELTDYHFTLVHKPGTSNRADAFSQWLDYDTGVLDNKDVIILGPELFTNATELLNLEQKVFTTQEECKEWITELQQSFPLDEIEGQWFYCGHPMVPESKEL